MIYYSHVFARSDAHSSDYKPPPLASSRTVVRLVLTNLGYFQTIRIYESSIRLVAVTLHTPTTTTTHYITSYPTFSPSSHLISFSSLSSSSSLLIPHHFLHYSCPLFPHHIIPYNFPFPYSMVHQSNVRYLSSYSLSKYQPLPLHPHSLTHSHPYNLCYSLLEPFNVILL